MMEHMKIPEVFPGGLEDMRKSPARSYPGTDFSEKVREREDQDTDKSARAQLRRQARRLCVTYELITRDSNPKKTPCLNTNR